MPYAYVQVRPVREDGAGRDRFLVRAFEGDEIFAWGLYATDADGFPMHAEDFDSREEAISAGLALSAMTGFDLAIDELDGTTTWQEAQ